MSKIINNAVISLSKCEECPNAGNLSWVGGKVISEQAICIEHSPFKKISNAIDTNTIDKDCPLQDVEVYPNDANLQNLLNMDTLSADFLNSIDHIIIVKKPTTDNKVEGDKTNE